MPKFKHLLRKSQSEVNKLPSMTEPQQVKPLDRLLQDLASGIPVPQFHGVFSDQDTPDIDKLDFVAIAQLRDDTLEGIELAKEDYHNLTVRMEELKKQALQASKESEKTHVVSDSNNTP